jgi:hypothetical protein
MTYISANCSKSSELHATNGVIALRKFGQNPQGREGDW